MAAMNFSLEVVLYITKTIIAAIQTYRITAIYSGEDMVKFAFCMTCGFLYIHLKEHKCKGSLF